MQMSSASTGRCHQTTSKQQQQIILRPWATNTQRTNKPSSLPATKAGTHKLKSLELGKCRSTRFFHHVNIYNLPAFYKHSIWSWLTFSTFEEWFFQIFFLIVSSHSRSLNLPEKAIFLLKKCFGHPRGNIQQTRDGHINAVCLPKDTIKTRKVLCQKKAV